MTTATFGYEIRQGVRRCVAAREAGKVDIPATIQEPGQPDVTTRITLTELYSLKDQISRDYRYVTDTEYKTKILGTEPDPIVVYPIKSFKRQTRLTHLPSVKLV